MPRSWNRRSRSCGSDTIETVEPLWRQALSPGSQNDTCHPSPSALHQCSFDGNLPVFLSARASADSRADVAVGRMEVTVLPSLSATVYRIPYTEYRPNHSSYTVSETSYTATPYWAASCSAWTTSPPRPKASGTAAPPTSHIWRKTA
jgi:hypothetical protein